MQIVAPPMQRQIQLLRQLVLDSQYAVDPAAVAGAILARAAARQTVVGIAFRNDLGGPLHEGGDFQIDGTLARAFEGSKLNGSPVRSFRPSRQARSFRPCNAKSVTQ